MQIKTLLTTAACLFASAFGAQAATTFTNAVVFDLTQANITADGSGGELLFSDQNLSLPSSFSPQENDILVTTVSFLPGQSLRITDGPNTIRFSGGNFESLVIGFGDSNLAAGPFTYGSSAATTTGAVFGDLSGELLQSGGSVTGILGQSICSCGGFGDVTTTSFEFSSVTLTTKVDSVPSDLNLDTIGLLSGRAGDFTVVTSPSIVPLPASGMLLLTGLAATGCFASRRRRPDSA